MSFGRAKRIWKFLTKIIHKWINNFEILKHFCWDWVGKLNFEKPNHPCSECQNYGLIILSKRDCLRQRFSTWGTRTPRGTWRLQGVREEPTGVCKIQKTSPKWSLFGLNFLFGGTQRGTILIWGYASTKRLRTPGLRHMARQKLPIVQSEIQLIKTILT